MNELTLGLYLRRERERRGLTLRTISESTKVSMALLEGLEADDISRWPGGIFRRAFVRSYAECVGLDPDEIFRRFEEQHRPAEAEPALPLPSMAPLPQLAAPAQRSLLPAALAVSQRWRIMGTAADLAVAVVVALGCAAAGSRLLWPVLLIAAYYALGTLLTGTTPMVALLSDQADVPRPSARPEEAAIPPSGGPRGIERRQQPRRTNERPRQRRGIQAGVRP